MHSRSIYIYIYQIGFFRKIIVSCSFDVHTMFTLSHNIFFFFLNIHIKLTHLHMMCTKNVQRECEIQSKPYSLCTLNLGPNHQMVISKAPCSKMIDLYNFEICSHHQTTFFSYSYKLYYRNITNFT